ncbi:GGDEF domain-containing protein [Pseudonocardia sp. KRD291]|uniref:GGDEF domain-containing protein n=1 Tax=Pseudonocardia sp. KRD291 TaxID=2792007 RepID=UPI001C4A3225|nr:GGDEF domain-containing protein [Pseudonocardia sp. KRD291]MBW0104048.1 GGDEF domain-containing protein [Pseudonocardia sp. KRD291]
MVIDALLDRPNQSSLVLLAYLTIAAIAYTEISHGVEQTRRRVGGPGHVDLTSVWTFAAAVTLPLSLATVAVVLIYLHFYARVLRPAKTPLYRQIFNAATVILAVHAAGASIRYIDQLPILHLGDIDFIVLVFALLTYTVVNTSLVVGVVAMTTPDMTFAQTLVRRGEGVGVEIATLCLGALVAATVTITGPLTLLFTIPPLLLLHRTVLSRQLVQEARIDSKTGVLNSAAWHLEATQTLDRARHRANAALLLMIDLDRFKGINDTHGHLAGDEVLSAVGLVLRGQVRGADVVGRFGGEEFVMLMPNLDRRVGTAETTAIAQRVRLAIADIRVDIDSPEGPITLDTITASVGGAVYPHDGEAVTTLLARADKALYAAKRAGRNRVRLVDSAAGPHLGETDHETR